MTEPFEAFVRKLFNPWPHAKANKFCTVFQSYYQGDNFFNFADHDAYIAVTNMAGEMETFVHIKSQESLCTMKITLNLPQKANVTWKASQCVERVKCAYFQKKICVSLLQCSLASRGFWGSKNL